MASQDHSPILQWHFVQVNPSNFHSYSHGLFLLLLFFAFIILITTLFLCFHLRGRHLSRPTATATVASPPLTHKWVEVDYATYSTHPLSTIAVAGFEKSECCICLSLFQDDEKLKVLVECQHIYHSECVDKWLDAHTSCPLCRASLLVNSNEGNSKILSELITESNV